MRAWERWRDMWCRDKTHVIVAYNMLWYALNQKEKRVRVCSVQLQSASI